jgi:hypothetical protein
MEFTAGLILGAILGVVADRIWEAHEAKPRFKITHSCFFGLSGNGLSFTVKNEGKKEIPPFDLVLFHPLRGSYRFFHAPEEEKSLLPVEERTFSAPLLNHEMQAVKRDPPLIDWVAKWLHREKDVYIDSPTADGFSFRLVMKRSERTLLESQRLGNTLAKVLLAIEGSREVSIATYDDHLNLNFPTASDGSMIRKWLSQLVRLLRRTGHENVVSGKVAASTTSRVT